MWRRSYRNHVIMAFPSYDTATNSWAPQADISWCAGSNRYSEFVRFHDRVMSEGEAVHFALRKGVAWIREHHKHSPAANGIAPAARGKSIATLKDSLRRLGSTSHPRLRRPLAHRSATVLTYDQFKALLARLGVNDSEPSLHKSYEALLKLRDRRHCSWLEIRKKVERSREMAAATKSLPRAMKKPRLPLTPQAWQRIV